MEVARPKDLSTFTPEVVGLRRAMEHIKVTGNRNTKFVIVVQDPPTGEIVDDFAVCGTTTDEKEAKETAMQMRDEGVLYGRTVKLLAVSVEEVDLDKTEEEKTS